MRIALEGRETTEVVDGTKTIASHVRVVPCLDVNLLNVEFVLLFTPNRYHLG